VRGSPEDVLGRLADLELQERRRVIRARVFAIAAVVLCGVAVFGMIQDSHDMVRIALAGRTQQPAPPQAYLCGTLTVGSTTRPLSIQVGESIELVLAEPATLRLRAQVAPCGAGR
jgi:hypothetical protein